MRFAITHIHLFYSVLEARTFSLSVLSNRIKCTFPYGLSFFAQKRSMCRRDALISKTGLFSKLK